MWPILWRRGPWLIVLLGIQSQLVYSEVIRYEDPDVNLENGHGDFRRSYGGYPEMRSNSAHCPLAVPCNLMASNLRAVRSLLTELETASNSYCRTAQNVMRFGPSAFPSFPTDSMQMPQMPGFPEFPEFPQFPQFPQFPSFPQFPQVSNNDPLSEQPPFQSPEPEYDMNQQNPNPIVENTYPEAVQPPSNVNPWGPGIPGPSKIKVHKKVKIKTCTPRRSGTGRKRYAAAMAPLQKSPEDEKNKVTVEVNVGTGAEDENRKSPSEETPLPEIPGGGQELITKN